MPGFAGTFVLASIATMLDAMHPRDLLIQSFQAAIRAVSPSLCLPPHLPDPPRGRTLVLGAGKAAAAMAACVEQHWPSTAHLDGLVITRHGYDCPTKRIQVVEAGHPIPDGIGVAAAARFPGLVAGLGPDDLLLGLVSGGGSSLLTLPAPGLALDDLRQVSRDLLLSGAPIQDINVVRKHLTTTLGGRLAAVCRSPVRALIISDVVGDDPTHIASGPFAPDPSHFAHAREILTHWQIQPTPAVVRHLEAGLAGRVPETPKPGGPGWHQVENRVIASGRTALAGAAAWLGTQGVATRILGDDLVGESRELARQLARLGRGRDSAGMHGPQVWLSGGETTVKVRGLGRGGRNSEFVLALALELGGAPGVHALAADTDGIDGVADNAGALIAPDTLARAANLGLDARACLDDNDAYGFFSALGDLVVSGPTRTNANDYRAILLA